MINTSGIYLLVFQQRNSNLKMVLNRVEVGVLRELQTPVYLLNFGVSMVTGHLLKAKTIHETNVKAILSVSSLSAMELPCTLPKDIELDLTLDVRDDSGDTDSSNFDGVIPLMDGIPQNAFRWHGKTS